VSWRRGGKVPRLIDLARNNNLSSVLTISEATILLTLGRHGGSLSPYGTYWRSVPSLTSRRCIPMERDRYLSNIRMSGLQNACGHCGYEKNTFFCGKGPRSIFYGRNAALRLIVQPCDEDDSFFFIFLVMEHRWSEIDRGKPKYSGKNLSTTNPTSTDPGSNPNLRGKRPATSRLSHGTVQHVVLPVPGIKPPVLGRMGHRQTDGYPVRVLALYHKTKCHLYTPNHHTNTTALRKDS
jgi:hypothetical protein